MRRLYYFLVYFLVWYGGSFLFSIGYELTHQSFMTKLLPIYTIAITFLFAYLYFRRSINDWHDRFVTTALWTILVIVLSTLLIQFVYGNSWKAFLTFDVLMTHWTMVASMLAAGVTAHRKQII